MIELLTALLYLFLITFFLTRDEDPTIKRPRVMEDDDTWP
jgi:hypothetical protein